MAERKAVNKYYPPDWDPSKGSVNKYVGQHPLRDRAKKLSQGILVIRFEMPYNIWCGGCNSHIGMGVRYNAEKSKVGNYYSTPIYKFRMKCHLCDNYFEIQTDPKNHDYVILVGARRKEQRWDPKDNEQIVPEDKATQKRMATDSMFKLEHGSDDVLRNKKTQSTLSNLELLRGDWKDDYMLNKMARSKFRKEKTATYNRVEKDTALLKKSSLDIPLLKETSFDVKLASLMKYRATEAYEEKKTSKRKEIERRPIFPFEKKKNLDTASSNKLGIIKMQLRKRFTETNPFDELMINADGRNSAIAKSKLMNDGIHVNKKRIETDQANNTTATIKQSMPDMDTSIISEEAEGATECELDQEDKLSASQNKYRIKGYANSMNSIKEYTDKELSRQAFSECTTDVSSKSDVHSGIGDAKLHQLTHTTKTVVNAECSNSTSVHTHLVYSNLPNHSATETGIVDNGKMAAQCAFPISGLSLVASYSDSDSDSYA